MASNRDDLEGTDYQVESLLRALEDYLPNEVFKEALKLNGLEQ